jgi:hypothetical protein
MSVNDTYRASSLEPEPKLTAENTTEQIAELKGLIPPSSVPVIAIDLDDVLCSTNILVAQCTCNLLAPLRNLTSLLISLGHNQTYGTQMTLDDFYCTLITDRHVPMHDGHIVQIITTGRQVVLMQCLLISNSFIPPESVLGNAFDNSHKGQGVLYQRSDITCAARTWRTRGRGGLACAGISLDHRHSSGQRATC